MADVVDLLNRLKQIEAEKLRLIKLSDATVNMIYAELFPQKQAVQNDDIRSNIRDDFEQPIPQPDAPPTPPAVEKKRGLFGRPKKVYPCNNTHCKHNKKNDCDIRLDKTKCEVWA